jgi:diguanylate cyclase (GGDEF)-like protein
VEADSNAKLLENPAQRKSLIKMLGQNEQARVLVEESVEELSLVNAGIKNVLEMSEAVEVKVQEASDKLAVANLALKDEIEDRCVLENKLAAVTEQGRIDLDAALHDPLTGLPNRALFLDRLEHGFQHARRCGRGLALLFLDLDDFKIINDKFGHDVGDGVLRMVAERLNENIRGEDTASRHGGDEFVILITEVRDETDISSIAEKIINKIQAPLNINAGDLTLSLCVKATIGISIFPKDGATADALVKSADTAMYEAKRNKSKYFVAQ